MKDSDGSDTASTFSYNNLAIETKTLVFKRATFNKDQSCVGNKELYYSSSSWATGTEIAPTPLTNGVLIEDDEFVITIVRVDVTSESDWDNSF